jgi:hypothetical protein
MRRFVTHEGTRSAAEDEHVVAVALLHDNPPLTVRGGGRQALLHAFASGRAGRGIGSNLLRFVHARLAPAGYCIILVKLVGVESPVHDWYRRMGCAVDSVVGLTTEVLRPWWVVAAPGESHAAIVLDGSLRICPVPLVARELAEASRGQSPNWLRSCRCDRLVDESPRRTAPCRPPVSGLGRI